jgi:hypothetical protein
VRQRTGTHRPHSADIRRREEIGQSDIGEPLYETVLVGEREPCLYEPEQTEFTREDGGERVSSPATVTFEHTADITEGDTVEIFGAGAPGEPLEVLGINRVVNQRLGRVVKLVAEVERA